MIFAFGPPHPPGSIWVEQSDAGPVLHLRGEIDTATVARFEAGPGAAGFPSVGEVIAVDVTHVTFLNSTGLALVIRSTNAYRESGHCPVLRGPTRAVLQVLRVTGTSALFEIR